MGKPKFSRKKYETPSHPWQQERINAENELIKKYGLANKKEIWKAQTSLRRYRGQARELLGKVESDDPQIKKESNQLLNHLTRYNILPLNSTLDDVLALDIEAVLSRRLQTITYLRGFANTPKQARQLISHGHIEIDGRKINVPSYMVTKNQEEKIGYINISPLNDPMHPARPSSEFKSTLNKKVEDEKISDKVELQKKAKTDDKEKVKKEEEKSKDKKEITIKTDDEQKEEVVDKKKDNEIEKDNTKIDENKKIEKKGDS
jgi:small subunit ribosomal protein S4